MGFFLTFGELVLFFLRILLALLGILIKIGVIILVFERFWPW